MTWPAKSHMVQASTKEAFMTESHWHRQHAELVRQLFCREIPPARFAYEVQCLCERAEIELEHDRRAAA